ncbi:MAG: hypothetical protein A2341_14950 [Deltaproteobacteria bacterium RIFOXYB12_FULL_58_9]|nr:MAG: hypothetical protein A2341_14950 [Deltaproteobacteria bacterium RIFOXYB12_FULL_58_9]
MSGIKPDVPFFRAYTPREVLLRAIFWARENILRFEEDFQSCEAMDGFKEAGTDENPRWEGRSITGGSVAIYIKGITIQVDRDEAIYGTTFRHVLPHRIQRLLASQSAVPAKE